MAHINPRPQAACQATYQGRDCWFRAIFDTEADEWTSPRRCRLFELTPGGLDLAVMAVTGARLAWTAETDRYAAGVLAHHWPGVPNLGDVTALDWARVPPVDLVSAGWPCQDISYAGRGPASRKGPAVDCGCTSPTAFATFDPATSTWRTSPRSARAASAKSSVTWPRSGMTRNGSACALPTPEPRTAATASSSSPSGPAQPQGSRLLPARSPGTTRRGVPADLAGLPGPAEETRP